MLHIFSVLFSIFIKKEKINKSIAFHKQRVQKVIHVYK